MPIVVETPRFRPGDLLTFRGYQQAGVAWLQYGVAVGAVYFVVGPLFAGLLPDVGWGLAVTSTALLIRGLLGIVINPITGWAIARFGVRRVVPVGGVFTAAFTALTAAVQDPIQFILVFAIALSIADAFMGHIPSATVVQRWFLARRGTVMGFVNSGAGFGGLIFAPLMAVMIHNFGWRQALVMLAVIILVLALPSLLLREGPREVGQWVDGVEGRVIPEPGADDDLGTPQREIGSIVRTPLFWMLFSIFGIEAWALGVYAADQVLYLKTVGVETIVSSGALGISGGVAALSGILFCRLSDRISPYFVLILATSTMTLGSIVFLFARTTPLLFAYSILFGAGYGLLVPTIPTALSRYFGARDFSRAFGVGTILTSIMGGLGPFVTGVISEASGSFTVPIYLVTGLLVLSVIIAALSRPPRYALAGINRVEHESGATGTAVGTVAAPDDAPPAAH